MRCLKLARGEPENSETSEGPFPAIWGYKYWNRGNWGLFFGWDPELIRDLPLLSATFLDNNFSATVPIVVIGQSGHVCWVNTPALTAGGITASTDSPDGGTIVKDENGNPTGQLFEEPAMMLVLNQSPPPDPKEITKGFQDQWRYYASVGLTTVTELGYMPSEFTDGILREMSDQSDCPIRLGLYKMEHAIKRSGIVEHRLMKPPITKSCCPQIVFGNAPTPAKRQRSGSSQGSVGNYNERLWEAGIKLVGDGSPHCGTMAVREPFMNTPLTEILGFPKAPGYGNLNMDSEALVDTIRFFHEKGTQIAIHCHGERASEQAVKAYEQDHPTYPGDAVPFSNMKTAVTRCTRDDPSTPYGPEYRVSVHEALKAYTVNAAFMLHREKDLGTITPGKKADLVVLSKNPYNVDPFKLEDIRVIDTYLDGHSNGLATVKSIPGANINILERPDDSQI
ncbi:hypothetical protein BSL78_02317 [Apostichopus japonicus]|uniref:Amidohydrolase 3 domain-containing protein n=1 Tax=Stichopus japonicus TaxID=307972 RepID=A0A2G8LKH2_STIJA|nr:hypothetical protein BSL78_02317 [Apostichopus japonicus]